MTSNSPPRLPPVVEQRGATNANADSHSEKHPLMHSRGLILAMLFGVTAVLGLPWLWYSPAFTTKEKWLWSLAIVVYTIVLCLIAVGAFWFAYSAISNSPSSFQ